MSNAQQIRIPKDDTWRMFDRIAPSYDQLNRLISFRRDVAWRKRLCRHLPDRNGQTVLDLATGTGDVLLSLQRNCARVGRGVGLDMSWEMLRLARGKVRLSGEQSLALMRGDACAIGAADDSFDAVTMAFGIRNVPDVGQALREIRRVLRPGGRALILEFSLPPNKAIRSGYLIYFRHILPRIGGLVSGDSAAYRYLNESVESFPYGREFCTLMERAQFRAIGAFPMTLGVVTLYQGDK